jgi:hypothetical protein
LVAADLHARWIFLYGFAKNERGNLDADELSALRRLAQAYLAMDEATLQRLLQAGELTEAKNGEPKAP